MGEQSKKILTKYLKRNLKGGGFDMIDYNRIKEADPNVDFKKYMLENYMKHYDRYDSIYISIGLKMAGLALKLKDDLFEEKKSDLFGAGLLDYRQTKSMMQMYRNLGKELYDLADKVIGWKYTIPKAGDKSKTKQRSEIRTLNVLAATRPIMDILGKDLYGEIMKLTRLVPKKGKGIEFDDYVRFVKTRADKTNLSTKWDRELKDNPERYLNSVEMTSLRLGRALQLLYFQSFRSIRSPEMII